MFFNLAYAFALLTLSPVIAYRSIRHGRYRRGALQKLFGLSKARASAMRGDAWKTVWLHAVSVGEVNLLPELIERMRVGNGKTAFVVSTSTDTGYDLACQRFGAENVFFAPLDFSWAVRRTLKSLQCKQLVLAELELWPNLIAAASDAEIPIAVINGRLSENSSRNYQKFSRVIASTFARLSAVGCQDAVTAERFRACGVADENLHVTGSLKFDNAPTTRDTDEVQSRALWASVDPWHRVWCVGSTQAGEEAMALAVYQRLRTRYPELRLILVPRHPERFSLVANLISAGGDRVVARSESHQGRRPGVEVGNDQWKANEVVLIDTVGELRHWWGVSQIATVGGSFGDRGGQNMLEPAGYGSAVSFGPNTKNFDTIANQLLAGGGAVRVADERELEAFVDRCLADAASADQLGRSAQAIVNRHRGAYDRTLEMLGSLQSFKSSIPIRRAA
ncbi:3-deoxy-D-manno-octulosonic-acid transferase [Neorhodopirellula lusitana]|uniref:3-deoxy-D-manno-octulosonic acid transferase n=1 Tax=Neorhodopirellula lusitana TaxID=445327 RepID=A0ABY1Q3M9_9BACT|nr:3-deoxy-D-manno-octulosonic acid transferase [Neorhodopirellula lusitana]SMP53851.1 3-deoxy-D-manno-octulosonic-acid transferase [Neorhodopirellula lusitana]